MTDGSRDRDVRMERLGVDSAASQEMLAAARAGKGELERERRERPLEPPEGVWPADTLVSDFLASSTMREYTSVLLSHLLYKNLIQQPQKTNTAMKMTADFKKGSEVPAFAPTPGPLHLPALLLLCPVPAHQGPAPSHGSCPCLNVTSTQKPSPNPGSQEKVLPVTLGFLPHFYLPRYKMICQLVYSLSGTWSVLLLTTVPLQSSWWGLNTCAHRKESMLFYTEAEKHKLYMITFNIPKNSLATKMSPHYIPGHTVPPFGHKVR